MALALVLWAFGDSETITSNTINDLIDETYNYIDKQSQSCGGTISQSNRTVLVCEDIVVENMTQENDAAINVLMCAQDISDDTSVSSDVNRAVDAVAETTKGLFPGGGSDTENIINLSRILTQNIVHAWNQECRSKLRQSNEFIVWSDPEKTVCKNLLIKNLTQRNLANVAISCIANNKLVMESRASLQDAVSAAATTKHSSLLMMIIIGIVLLIGAGLLIFGVVSIKGVEVFLKPEYLTAMIGGVALLWVLLFFALRMLEWWPFKKTDKHVDDETKAKNKKTNRSHTLWLIVVPLVLVVSMFALSVWLAKK